MPSGEQQFEGQHINQQKLWEPDIIDWFLWHAGKNNTQSPANPELLYTQEKYSSRYFQTNKGWESSLSADFKKNSREYCLCKNIRVVRKEQRARKIINVINLNKYWPYKTMVIMSAEFQIYTKLKYLIT